MQVTSIETTKWVLVAKEEDVPANGGSCVMYKNEQIAIFNFKKRDEWYATQNMCPHKKQMILSRGMIGDKECEPKVACPYHKKNFSLKTGENLNGEEYSIKTYPIKVEAGNVYIGGLE